MNAEAARRFRHASGAPMPRCAVILKLWCNVGDWQPQLLRAIRRWRRRLKSRACILTWGNPNSSSPSAFGRRSGRKFRPTQHAARDRALLSALQYRAACSVTAGLHHNRVIKPRDCPTSRLSILCAARVACEGAGGLVLIVRTGASCAHRGA